MKKNLHKKVLIVSIISLILMLSSCETFSRMESLVSAATGQGNPSSDEVEFFEVQKDSDCAYIYGRFYNVSRKNYTAGKCSAYVNIKNKNTGEEIRYVMTCSSTDSLQIAAVPPGEYILTSIGTIDNYGVMSDSDDLDSTPDESGTSSSFDNIIDNVVLLDYNRTFTVKKNTAMYLGDFGISFSAYDNGFGWVFLYNPLPPLDNFETTTQALLEKYPNLGEEKIDYVSNIADFPFANWNDKFIFYNAWGEMVEIYDESDYKQAEEEQSPQLTL